MATFIANNLIRGKLTWAKVEASPTYAHYKDAAKEVLAQKGYTINEAGACVPAAGGGK